MKSEEAHRLILDALKSVAPEIDSTGIDPERDLTEQLDIDSMDYLNWMLEINRETGIEIPERDYEQLMTVADAVRYLVGASAD